MDLQAAMRIASSGMKAQSSRLRVVAENLANTESTANTSGGEPYRRKTITFDNALDRASGLELVRVKRYGTDNSELQQRHMPGHPAADAAGYVSLPNVNPFIELMDMREAQRSYEANLNTMQSARSMLQRTLDILR